MQTADGPGPCALVTGCAGFIGFHVSRWLLDHGYRVVGIDALTDYYDPALKQRRLDQLDGRPRFEFIHGRIEDQGLLHEVFGNESPRVVVHLAAQAGVRYALEAPQSYVSSNVLGTFSLLEACRVSPPDHLLLASSSSVYGETMGDPSGEIDRADRPVSLYAATKLATENIAHSYSHLHQIPITCLRFFTVYGPWGRPDMALFKFVAAITEGRPIEIYGDGTAVRDFTYIDDLTAAIGGLIDVVPATGKPQSPTDSLSRVAPFRTVNIGGGQPQSLNAFITSIEDSLGKQASRIYSECQLGDVRSTEANPSLLNALIGGTPKTPIQEGVAAFVAWHQSYQAGERNV